MDGVTPISAAPEDPFIATDFGDGLEVGITTFGSSHEPQRELVFIQDVGRGTVSGLTKGQAKALALRLVDLAILLEPAPPTEGGL